jgi:hypothetical protein
MKRYLIDVHTNPPVVVTMVREQALEVSSDVAQRYADQTQHVLVWATGPDSVTEPTDRDVIHPVGHAPAPPQPPAPPVTGVSLAPAHERHAALGADLSAAWEYLKSLEGPALNALFEMIAALVGGKKK